jgi:GTP:adenosylcobinamide-phosphate guanylyltransferase
LSCIYVFTYSILKSLIKSYFKIYKLIFTSKISVSHILIFLNRHTPKIKEIKDNKRINILKYQNKSFLKEKLQLLKKLNTKIINI